MTAAIKKTLYTQKALYAFLCTSCVSLFVLYMYFVSVAIVEVVIRTELSQEINQIASEISELENAYIKAQHKVSSDIASLQGYQKSSEKIFIERDADSLVLAPVPLR
jgi:hypothetical protein